VIFALASKTDRNNYQAPDRGYLYFTIKAGKEEATRKEWPISKRLAATGQVSDSACAVNSISASGKPMRSRLHRMSIRLDPGLSK
jgi:hypothetical protein